MTYLSNNWNKKSFARENFWKVSQQMLKCFSFFPFQHTGWLRFLQKWPCFEHEKWISNHIASLQVLNCLPNHLVFLMTFTSSQRAIWENKKMQGETEGAMKISASRASKQAPTWHSCTITPKSLSSQPLYRLIQTWSRGWPERDIGVIVQLCHVGAHFEALDALIFTVASVVSCIFLRP